MSAGPAVCCPRPRCSPRAPLRAPQGLRLMLSAALARPCSWAVAAGGYSGGQLVLPAIPGDRLRKTDPLTPDVFEGM